MYSLTYKTVHFSKHNTLTTNWNNADPCRAKLHGGYPWCSGRQLNVIILTAAFFVPLKVERKNATIRMNDVTCE